MAKKRHHRTPQAGKTNSPASGPQKNNAHHGRSIALACVSGCLWFLACANFDIWPLAYVAMLPAFWVVENAPTRRRALLYGWVAGLVANLGGFYWISGLLERFGHLPFPIAALGLLLLAGYQASVFWLFFFVLRSIRNRSREQAGTPLPMILLAPLLMVTFEYLVPFLFPWYLAITQAWVLPVIQVAEFTGPLGVTAFVMLINGAVYDIATSTLKQRISSAAVALVVIAGVLTFGFVRIGQINHLRAAAPSLAVGVVQGNIPFDEKGSHHKEVKQHQLSELQRVSAELESQGAEFLMWPESSYPYWIPRNAKRDSPAHHRRRIRKGFTSPLMFGAETYDPEFPDAPPYNSALLLDSQGNYSAKFDKIFLLMFGEYTPFLETFPFLKNVLPENASHFSRGHSVKSFPLSHHGTTYRLGPMICYEDILPDFGRRLASSHPHLLVNVTNDSWFGDTSEPWEHLALSVYRAVEMRTDMVRAVNTGVSAFIDANGRVYEKSYAVDPKITPKPADGLLGTVHLIEGGHTFYSRFGNVFAFLCVVVSLFFLLGWPHRHRLRKHLNGLIKRGDKIS